MALFSKKKSAPKAAPAAKAKGPVEAPVSHAHVLVRPRITEKAGIAAENNIYTFEVTPKATKVQVALAVKEIYKVTPIKVRTVTLPAKDVVVRGKYGRVASVKKALVELKEGDKIEFI
jgi:large subunit ribosomal protein L23